MLIDSELIRKYNIRGPRYTSYPTANQFYEGITPETVREHILMSNTTGPANISLYFHIPFCPKLCHFCGCSTHLNTRENLHSRYIDVLLAELNQVLDLLDPQRPVTQVHWGGGTPNAIRPELIAKVMNTLHGRLKMDPAAEIAIECNPAYLDRQWVENLAGMGFNRISLGIQDFNSEVLKAVNRDPSKLPIGELIPLIRQSGISGINLDFIYGLPLQTIESFLATIGQAIQLRPDRLVTFSYAHVPWVKKAQLIMENLGLPDENLKMKMLEESAELLKTSGYEMVGMDHYALPEDSLAVARREHTLHRNFQGYCTRKTTGQVYAFGASAITQLETAYFQTEKETNAYMQAVNSSQGAVRRGYLLNTDERMVRSVITEVMCNGRVDFHEIGGWFGTNADTIKEMLHYNILKFKELENDGLVIAGEDGLEITARGEYLARVIALNLDPQERDQTIYSKTI